MCRVCGGPLPPSFNKDGKTYCKRCYHRGYRTPRYRAGLLAPLLRRAAPEFGSLNSMARAYADRYGVTHQAAARNLWRILGGQETTYLDSTDRWLTLIGHSVTELEQSA